MITNEQTNAIAVVLALNVTDVNRLNAFSDQLALIDSSPKITLNIPQACQILEYLNAPNEPLTAVNKGLRCVIALLLSSNTVEENVMYFLSAYRTAYENVIPEALRGKDKDPAWQFGGSNNPDAKIAERKFYQTALRHAMNNPNETVSIPHPEILTQAKCEEHIKHAQLKAKNERERLQYFTDEINKVKKAADISSPTSSPCLLSKTEEIYNGSPRIAVQNK